MNFLSFSLFISSLFSVQLCFCQADSTIEVLEKIPLKYISSIDKKVNKYSKQITSKTEKTLEKLSRWENKIKGMLQKVSPATAEQLFGAGQQTFGTVLQRIKEGKQAMDSYQAKYDSYRDKLTTDLKYLSTQKEQLNQKILKPLASTKEKVDKLSAKMDDTEALGEFIKERKKQLITSSIQYIGKSKYLNKINKEAFYYVETMKNYKEIFSDPKKAEETVKEILSKIPAFQKFAQENSPLSRLFTLSGSFPTLSSGGSVPIVNGLPSRNLVQNLMQANFPLGIPSPLQKLQSLEAKPLLDGLKDSSRAHNKIDDPRVPTFKPNTQRAVPFKKRLEFGSDLEFGKSTNYLPATANIALKIGYKLNDKSSAGMGINYLLGIGRGWNNVRFTNNGIGLRTYLKWKLKKGLDIQGGGEWNHLSFTNFDQLKIVDEWQQSALLGICKSYAIGKKLKGNVQILHDFLYNHHVPVSPPFLFRFGYGF